MRVGGQEDTNVDIEPRSRKLSLGVRILDDLQFRKAMGKFTTGVTVITAVGDGNHVHGMTANAFMSVSLNPRLILISVSEQAKLNQFIETSGKFGISVLSNKQRDVSMHFAGQRNNNSDEIKIEFKYFNDQPVIEGALVNLVCSVNDHYKAGDHILYVGKVEDLSTKDGEPLAFFDGQYNRVDSA